MIKVYMGIPSTGNRSDAQNYHLREIERKYKDKVELVYPKQCVFRIFHDYARNCVVDEFLRSDCDILWFLDSDVVPPINILDLVTEHGDKWKLAGAPYPVFMTPSGVDGPQVIYTVYRNDGKGLTPTEIPTGGGTDFVDGIATGCIFIRREVIEQLKKPYFEFKFKEDTREMSMGEDLGFCVKVNELGLKFFTDFSMVCKHYKTVDLLEVNNYAIQYAQNLLLAYQRGLRQQIAERKLGMSRPKSGLILP